MATPKAPSDEVKRAAVGLDPHVSLTAANQYLYVPAQNTQGEPPDTESGELEYYAGDCNNQDTSTCDLVYTRPEAKPLIITYNDGIETEEALGGVGLMTGAGFGERDAFAALSLDDGATWKNWNLSDSAARSSFIPTAPGTDLRGVGFDYEGFAWTHGVGSDRRVDAHRRLQLALGRCDLHDIAIVDTQLSRCLGV